MLPVSTSLGMGRARGARVQNASIGAPPRSVTSISMNAQSRPFPAPESAVNFSQSFMIPYPTPYVYTAPYSTFPSYTYNPVYYQPIAYVPVQAVQPLQYPYYPKSPSTPSTNKVFRNSTAVSETVTFAQNQGYGYATAAAASARSGLEQPNTPSHKLLDINLDVQGFHDNILQHLKLNNECRVSWLNRMLAKCNTPEDFEKAKSIFMLYHDRVIETTPETGTLLIKAACRADVPEQALEMLQDAGHIRIWPTLGGIHYLMINFSLRKNTRAVIDAYEVTKIRHLKPTQRTYHILIRECVDNNLMAEAMHYAKECIENKIVPNRVAYNILMNGYRKENKPEQILVLREEMKKNEVEINDTTVKFTVLAHMMLGNTAAAVKEFTSIKDQADFDMEKFCEKFFEVVKDEAPAHTGPLVAKLFDTLTSSGEKLPQSVLEKQAELKTSLAEGQAAEKAPAAKGEGEATVEAKA